MSDPEHQRRATSFGSVAEEYARYRPGPPLEAVRWAIARATGPAGPVVDLAAGTGNVARELLGLPGGVVAVDLDWRMLEILGRRLPAVSRVAGRGEALPLGAGTARAVVISSAWHWLDPERAWPELGRVLRPGGSFAVLWSGPDRQVEWVADVLGQRHGGRASESPRPPGGRRWRIEIPPGAPFSAEQARTFTATLPYAVADLPGLAASYSRVITLAPEERRGVERQVADRAAARAELDGATVVDLPLRCRVWRALRT